MSLNILAVGDVVVLRGYKVGESVRMTVMDDGPHGSEKKVLCGWFDKNACYHQEWFWPDVLVRQDG